jgi:intracellular multiplication protein IcmJ
MNHEITLQAISGNWRIFTARKADPAFLAFQKKVLLRDRYTCQFCGFQAKLFQEIVNLDSNYLNNKLSNLATSCCFCAQCFFLESVGMGDYGGGTLIYLPEVTQGELNSICHVLFCAITNNTGYKNSAQSIYRSYKFRSQIIEDKYGEGSSESASFGQMIIDSGINDYQTLQKVFKNIRVLPSRAKFRSQIEKWAAAALEEITTETS